MNAITTAVSSILPIPIFLNARLPESTELFNMGEVELIGPLITGNAGNISNDV